MASSTTAGSTPRCHAQSLSQSGRTSTPSRWAANGTATAAAAATISSTAKARTRRPAQRSAAATAKAVSPKRISADTRSAPPGPNRSGTSS